MQLLISDVSELKMPSRGPEINAFLTMIGYRICAKGEELLLASDYGQWNITTPAIFIRYDRDHFLSVRFDSRNMDLPYLKKLRQPGLRH
ncbi:hypothetical protein [Secundilactobacillus folii]|uniref:Uncharacterized protein n=1 Tax=Secundilactobacillus folii TaxID=2678357 RepID=A0A7X3C277_9LACO|nr:hypothetical protein [Secundilactobacillus folii]MTV82545.1 hypothetical protein [Secundilactobacillus folii]